MESNGYEHQLFEAVRALTTLTNLAYWRGQRDCGSDMGAHCIDCQHHQACQANSDLREATNKLADWNC